MWADPNYYWLMIEGAYVARFRNVNKITCMAMTTIEDVIDIPGTARMSLFIVLAMGFGTTLLGKRFRRLLNLSLMCLIQDRTQDLLDSHRHLPALLLLLGGDSVAPGGRRVVPVLSCSVP